MCDIGIGEVICRDAAAARVFSAPVERVLAE